MELGTHFITACIQFKREAMLSQNPCSNWKRTYMNIWITLVQNSMRTVLQYALEYFGDVCRRFSLSLADNMNTPFLLFTFLENKPLNDHKAYLFWKRAQSCLLRNAYMYNDLYIDLSCLPACTGNSNDLFQPLRANSVIMTLELIWLPVEPFRKVGLNQPQWKSFQSLQKLIWTTLHLAPRCVSTLIQRIIFTQSDRDLFL